MTADVIAAVDVGSTPAGLSSFIHHAWKEIFRRP